jgi:hypothetical protein
VAWRTARRDEVLAQSLDESPITDSQVPQSEVPA